LTALPARTFAALLACVLVLATPATAVVAATTADAPPTRLTTTAQSADDSGPCDDGEYRPPDLNREWNPEFFDSLGDASQSDWTGGRVVRVGATGDCSLAVLDSETATLTAVTVDGTRGVLTGTLDLGANGSLALVATNESTPPDVSTDGPDAVTTETDAVGTSTAVTTGTTAPVTTGPHTTEPQVENRTSRDLILSNDARDFAPSVVVASGGRSTRVALQTGRFFHFVVRRDGGTTRVAVWDASRSWDGQWDVRFPNATESTDWRVRLHGRAFLDGVAVGVGEASRTPGTSDTGAPDETPVGDGSDDDPFPREDPDPVQVTNDGPDGSGDGRGFYGILLVVFGVVSFRYARGITRFGEQIDAIGSTTPMSEVEAADWNVGLTKVISAILAVVGLGMLVGALL